MRLMISLIMATGLLAACGDKESEDSAVETEAEQTETEDTSEETEDTSEESE